MCMKESSAHDLPQNIAPTIVRRKDTVCDEKGCGPEMVGDHAQRGGAAFAFLECFFANKIDAAQFRGAPYQRHKEIGVVVGDDALEDGSDAVETHAGIHTGFWQ